MNASVKALLVGLCALNQLPSRADADRMPILYDTTPVHDVHVEIEPASGRITILSQSHLNGVEMVFDPAEWLEAVEVSHSNEPFNVVEQLPLIVPAGSDGDTVKISAKGTIPDLEATLISAGNTSDGIFLFDYDAWLPTTPDSTSQYSLTIIVPADYRAVSTGDFMSEQINDGAYEAQFVFEAAENGPSVFVGPYVVAERLRSDLRLRTYFHSESQEFAEAYLDATETYIDRFSSQIGPYPYDGFSVVSAPIPVGLGFNSLTYISKDILRHDYMRGRSLAHEVLHSWWGNGVRVDYETGNWAEGLTTYQADYGLVEDQGREAAKEMRLEWLRNLVSLSPDLDVPVRNFRSTSHDGNQAIGYDKAAMIFHMLRNKLGDETFQDAIQTFWEANRSKRAGWSDIQKIFEETTASNLNTFFDQWVDRSGLPEASISAAAVKEIADSYQIELTLAQEAPVYELLLPVRIETDHTVETVFVTMTESSQTFTLDASTLPRSVGVDPDFDIARQFVAGEQVPIFRDAFSYPDPAVMIATQQPHARDSANDVAQLLFRGEVEFMQSPQIDTAGHPNVVIGLTEDVAHWVETNLTNPPTLLHAGTARAWTAMREDAAPYLFVSADNADILATAFDALRFYGNRSFVVFDGGEVADVGVWSSGTSALTVIFD